MIFAKTNKYGLDQQIYLIQQRLESKLNWFTSRGGVVESTDFRIYGRVYKNNSEGGIRPENFLEDTNKDYSEILNSDKQIGQIAFNILDRRTENQYNEADLDIIFTLDVNQIWGNILFETERTILEAQKAIGYSYGNQSGDVKEGVNDVFSGFDIGGMEYDDHSPRYIFSIPVTAKYRNDSCKTRVTTGQVVFTADNNTITVDNNEITVDQIIL